MEFAICFQMYDSSGFFAAAVSAAAIAVCKSIHFSFQNCLLLTNDEHIRIQKHMNRRRSIVQSMCVNCVYISTNMATEQQQTNQKQKMMMCCMHINICAFGVYVSSSLALSRSPDATSINKTSKARAHRHRMYTYCCRYCFLLLLPFLSSSPFSHCFCHIKSHYSYSCIKHIRCVIF